VTLAHELGFGVVAEGIETMRAWVQSGLLGADRAQGWLIAPGLSHRDLLERLSGGALTAAGDAVHAARKSLAQWSLA
jgi:EAL domain-containing protein (putative c-di-GMP-specific phosphodiesterase class I)